MSVPEFLSEPLPEDPAWWEERLRPAAIRKSSLASPRTPEHLEIVRNVIREHNEAGKRDMDAEQAENAAIRWAEAAVVIEGTELQQRRFTEITGQHRAIPSEPTT